MLNAITRCYRIFFFTRSVVSILRLAYWCGQLQVFDGGVEMLHDRIEKGGRFTISSTRFDEYRDGDMMEESQIDEAV